MEFIFVKINSNIYYGFMYSFFLSTKFNGEKYKELQNVYDAVFILKIFNP